MSSDAAAQPPRAPGTVAEMVRAASGSLPPAEARVAQALLTRGVDVVHSSVTEVAVAADTGIGTVVRACQSLAHLLVIDTLFTSLVLSDPRRARPAQQLTADVLAEHRC